MKATACLHSMIQQCKGTTFFIYFFYHWIFYLTYCQLKEKDDIRRKINSKKIFICGIGIIILICQNLVSDEPVQQKIKLLSPEWYFFWKNLRSCDSKIQTSVLKM